MSEVEVVTEAKKNPDAKVRNKPDPIFDNKHPKVTDDKDHFPIDTEDRARNAWARAHQTKDKAPKWFDGTFKEFISIVKKAIKKNYPQIELSESVLPTQDMLIESANYWID